MIFEKCTMLVSGTKLPQWTQEMTSGGWRGWDIYQLALLDYALRLVNPPRVICTELACCQGIEAIVYNFD